MPKVGSFTTTSAKPLYGGMQPTYDVNWTTSNSNASYVNAADVLKSTSI